MFKVILGVFLKACIFRSISSLVIAALATMLLACSVIDVQTEGVIAEVVSGDGFKHQVYRNRSGNGKILHVYLEGDGRPWLSRRRIALDPTPKNPLMLKLMSLDSAPSVYVGRPCYFIAQDDNCSPQWWTQKRYAAEVVSSLNQVIQQYAENYEGIALFGHSGGGSLAMLVAAQREDVVALMTLAGNLDIDRWAIHHGYSPLVGSLNPANQPALNQSILQKHFLGALDINVMPEMVLATIERQIQADFYLLDNVDHSCCWRKLWPQLLLDLERELAEPDS